MRRPFLAVLVLIGLVASLSAQRDTDAAWNAFLAWFKTAPAAGNPLAGYGAKLQWDGLAPADITQEIRVLTGLMAERSDWIGIYYDKVYVRPATGDPARVSHCQQNRPSPHQGDRSRGPAGLERPAGARVLENDLTRGT